ncbi:MAG TPA: alpha-1,2-fucosyltransferase [Candidatus Latescibacteria bacterium]|nr:alpha-1,2-fucosyltransferase [Candidatus Latescibacterota bacterium]
MVIVQLTGGLGNQLFQYATARAIAHRNAVPLKLDTSWFKRYPQRAYGLGGFMIEASVATMEEIEELCPPRWSLRWAGGQARDRTKPYSRRRVVRERWKRFDPALLKVGGDAYLIGCWQSERYFMDIAELIRRELVFKTPPDERNAELLSRIDETDSVSLHIRRGDYVTNPVLADIYGTPGLQYYARALEVVAGHTNAPHVFVFSDDIPWARENFVTNLPTEFVCHNGPGKEIEDLRLMSRCRHHIIANSSFSWWGAWLAEHPGQLVIAPDPWFRDRKWAPADIVSVRWTTLPV